MTLVTHSGFTINTHNLSVRQENALELFLWSRCKIRNNVQQSPIIPDIYSFQILKKTRLDKSSLIRMLNESVS